MKLALLGAGSLGKLVANIAREAGHDLVGLWDDDPSKVGTTHRGIEIKGTTDDFRSNRPTDNVAVCVGNLEARTKLFEKLETVGFSFPPVVHPSAEIAGSAHLGEGTIVKELAVVEPDVVVGKNCILGNHATICHDCHLGDHVRIAPGVTVAGHASIGTRSYLSVNVSVDRTIEIGTNCIIASGCTIFKDVPDNRTVKLPQKMEETPRDHE